ncbi:heavy metal translocating P-type ATPase [uncultured Ruminococcus sp.]|uniref:heavy metal translocating P-type ATPase n=1 Tax=uncultured Ruminococcus sp. TaxID=165186 RepID=UPI0026128E4D|nr:heavy metal translocating P-type ATPase [uncultured Ruminococcus sp.]
MTRQQRKILIKILIGGVLFAAAMLVTHLLTLPWWGELVIFLAVYLVPGWSVLAKAARNIAHGQVFDENFLMTIASIAAFAIGEYPEAVEVILFYQVGELFEKIAVGRSRQAVSDLLDLCPDEATVLRDGKPETVLVEEVAVGEHILVRPGEKFPLDAEVFQGHTTIDTAALTGESMPVSAAPGDGVCSGCVNLSGAVELVVTKPASESTASKIMELVETSASQKAKTEQFITRFARYYTPCVVIAAVILAIVPPLITGQTFSEWIYRALTFLIISCPCALVISVPLSFFGGIGCASKNGILVKGSNYLEALARAQTVVMDKTGTLTQGKFRVTKQYALEISEEEQLELAALAESASNHPIAQSLRDAYGKPLDSARVTELQERAGHGVSALVDGRQVLAGNAAYLEDAGLEPAVPDGSGTAVHVAVDGVYAGYLLIADSIKPDAAEAVQTLRKSGVTCVAMLTGDSESAAQEVGETLYLDAVHAKCLPTDKVQHMQEYRKKLNKGRTLVFVGDGMNDAPVLAQSDVGVAMGGLGSDAAIAAADLVILDDKPSKLGVAVQIAKKTMGIAQQNIVFALGVKAIVLVLGACGLAHIGAAVFADVGVSVIAILNSMRAMRAVKSKEK